MSKKIFIKTIFLLTILIVCDFLAGKGLKFLYFKQSQGKLYNITVALEQQTADVLIIGSSRAMYHYNPDILSDSLNISCFNAGNDGQTILYHNAILDIITERYNPKMVILDMNIRELEKDENENSYHLLYVLNPYIAKYPVLWNTLSLRPFEKIKHLSYIYPYNSMFVRIIMGNLKFKTKDVTNTGFKTLVDIWKDDLEKLDIQQDNELDKNKIAAFNQFIQTCKDKGIIVCVVISPSFQEITNRSMSIDYAIDKCRKENISFISYLNNVQFRDRGIFHDPAHLNYIGADMFSSDIARLLKDIYKEKRQ